MPSKNKPTLPQSLEPLARIAIHNAGAEGCSIYQVDSQTGQRELKFAWGAPVPDTETLDIDSRRLDSFPLHVDEKVDGLLTLVFAHNTPSGARRALLERLARSIEAVWRLRLLPDSYARKAARIGELEAELADAKIADRARGMLASVQPMSGDAIEAITRHVESVVRPGQLESVLAELTSEVERQIADRALASRAKILLQTRYGMSEVQAHNHLHLVSRKSRRRLGDVAREVLKEPQQL
jgi:ANTAR domain